MGEWADYWFESPEYVMYTLDDSKSSVDLPDPQDGVSPEPALEPTQEKDLLP